MLRFRSRQRGQSVIEFGIIAILFTLIMFAICDFGLLLNDWLSVSSEARLLARDAAVGMFSCDSGCPGGTQPQLINTAKNSSVPGVSADPYFGSNGYCCNVAASGNPGSALQLTVTYWDQCSTPGLNGCSKVKLSELDSRYSSDGQPGGCSSPCPHPAAPGKPFSCGPIANPSQFCPGDYVTLTLTAAGAQVITPLVRPFFTNPTSCQATSSHCYVPLSITVAMRFEGGVAP